MEVELRIALIIIGIIALVALYFFGRSSRIQHLKEDEDFDFQTNDFPDPLELDDPLESDINIDIKDELSDISEMVREDIAESPRVSGKTLKHQPSLLDEKPKEAPQEEKLVVLHVVARRPDRLKGNGIVNLSKELDLEYDDMHVFHKKIERYSGKRSIYSVVNMVKPGTFDLSEMDEFETPGVSFVMNLPGPEEGLKAFNIMLEAAKQFADRLDGDLLDESRSMLSPQTIAHLQEDVQLFSLKNSRRNM